MGLTEGKVALYSSVVFGAVHLSSVLATGATGSTALPTPQQPWARGATASHAVEGA